LILRKIIKISATRCHISKLKCTKFDFEFDSAPDPAYSAPLAGFKGSTSKEKGEREGKGKRGEGEGKVEWGREGKERGGREK